MPVTVRRGDVLGASGGSGERNRLDVAGRVVPLASNCALNQVRNDVLLVK
jgi:hypothetical protein